MMQQIVGAKGGEAMCRSRPSRCPGFGTAVRVAASGLATAAAALSAQAVDTWELSDRPLIAVGGIEDAAQLTFSRIGGALRLSDGRLVVADVQERRIWVLDRSGDVHSRLGGQGDGPGEFRSIAAIWNAGGDTIGVWDPRAPRITRLLPDGRVLATDAPSFDPGEGPNVGGSLEAFMGAVGGGRIVLAWLIPRRLTADTPAADRMVLGRFDRSGRFERVLGEETGMIRVLTSQVGGPFAFSPFPWSAVVRDTLIYTNGLEGTISFFDPFGVAEGAVRVVRLSGRQMALSDAWQALDTAMSNAETDAPSRHLARNTDRSWGEVPRYARMFADSEGRLWLKEYEPSRDSMLLPGGRLRTGGRWVIVERDGTVVARLTVPEEVAPIAVYGGELLAVERDDLGVERFVVYRVSHDKGK